MNLIDFLRKNENTRKVFGKRELKIIEKQLFGVNLTQSERNRLSRDIRKKLDFIKDISRFSEQFELKKGAVIKEKVEHAKEVIVEDVFFKNIKRMIWYGSTLENKVAFNSDIDIAIEFFHINKKEATIFRKRVQGKVDSQVDVQIYNLIPEKIKKEIDLKGKVLYKK